MAFDLEEYLKRNRINPLSPQEDPDNVQSAANSIERMQQLPDVNNAYSDAASQQNPQQNIPQVTPDPQQDNSQQTQQTQPQNPIQSTDVRTPPDVSTPQSSQLPKSLYESGDKNKAYQAEIPQEPMKSDFHIGKGRRIASILAGIGGGFVGGLPGAIGLSRMVADNPYNSAHKNYEQKLGNLKSQADIETGQNVAGQKYYTDLAKQNEEAAKGRESISKANSDDRGGAPMFDPLHPSSVDIPKTTQLNQSKHTSANTPPVSLHLKNGTTVNGFFDHVERKAYDPQGRDITDQVVNFDPIQKTSGAKDPLTQQINLQEIVKKYEDNPSSDKTTPEYLAAKSLLKTGTKDTTLFRDLSRGHELMASNDPKQQQLGKEMVTHIMTPLANSTENTKLHGDAVDLAKEKEILASKEHSAKVLADQAKPVEAQRDKATALEESVRQAPNNPYAASLIVPQLIGSVSSSSNRANQAEYKRVIGGVGNFQKLQAYIQAYQIDPNKAGPLTPEMLGWAKQIASIDRQRADKKSQILEEGRRNLEKSNDPKEHMKITNDAISGISDLNAGDSGKVHVQVPGHDPGYVSKSNLKKFQIAHPDTIILGDK